MLFTIEEYKKILEDIQNRRDFQVEKTYKKYSFELYTSRAGCDFLDGTKKGDYIICYDTQKYFGDWEGTGGPIGAEEFLQRFDTYTKFIEFVNEKNPYSYAEQMKLF